MNLNLEDLNIIDFFHGNTIELQAVQRLLGTHFDKEQFKDLKLVQNEPNFWVWHPLTSSSKIVKVVYSRLNKSMDLEDSWIGWKTLWRLKVAPTVKLFMWKMLHGKIPSFAFLYKLNIGPSLPCLLCGLTLEATEHVFWNCNKLNTNLESS